MTNFNVRPAQNSDRDGLARMRALLWPDGSVEEHLAEVELVLKTGMCGALPGGCVCCGVCAIDSAGILRFAQNDELINKGQKRERKQKRKQKQNARTGRGVLRFAQDDELIDRMMSFRTQDDELLNPR